MKNYDFFFCTKTYPMNNGDIAFKKGNFYKGIKKESHGLFKSDVSNEMKHTLSIEDIDKHLKIFKLGR